MEQLEIATRLACAILQSSHITTITEGDREALAQMASRIAFRLTELNPKPGQPPKRPERER